MDIPAAEIIARILGPLYVISGIGMLVSTDSYRNMIGEFWANPVFACLGGFFATGGGLVILAFHSNWATDWTLLITLIGWIAVVKGALLLVMPRLFEPISRIFETSGRLRAWAIAPLLLGGLLSVLGYGAV